MQKRVIKKISNSRFKLIISIFALIISLIVFAFLIWFIIPSNKLYVAILDKTVPATSADANSYVGDVNNIYRKHIGFNWILNYKKIKNPVTKKKYNLKKDYYGYLLDDDYKLLNEYKNLSSMDYIPDLLYLTDAYGTEFTDSKGITSDDMNVISLTHSLGGVIIGEQDIMSSSTDSDISLQLQKLFGITQSGWVGRYIYDLSNLKDVPSWAPEMYKKKYGVEWRCTGTGIILVSGEGDIIVLEERKDFVNENLLTIKVCNAYKKEFGKLNTNYYGWFELLETTGNSERIAEYEFNLNSSGMEKFAPVSSTPVFAAVVRNSSDKSPTYYFAGDFGDYISKIKPSNFLFADSFFRLFSFDRSGDVSFFYWNFYEPMMKKIVSSTSHLGLVDHKTSKKKGNSAKTEVTRINDNSFEVMINGSWQKLPIKGFNLNAEEPGNGINEYSKNVSYYKQLLDYIDQMGGNAVRAYDLYSPEFYRALYEHNQTKDASIILLYQGIGLPSETDKNLLTDENSLKLIHRHIENTIDALHGKPIIEHKKEDKRIDYLFDVSKYIASYIVDPDLNESLWRNLLTTGYTYEGKYFSSTANPAEAFLANLCDKLMTYQLEKNKTKTVIIANGFTPLLSGAAWRSGDSTGFNPSNITVSDEIKNFFGVSFTAKYSDEVYTNYADRLTGSYPSAYENYLEQIHSACKIPVMIDDFGASTCADANGRKNNIVGLSETEQSNQIIEMYKDINKAGFVGGLIADLNDSWAKISDANYVSTVPFSSRNLWHDVSDTAQTSGVIALNAAEPEEAGVDFTGGDQEVSSMQLSENESYLYITVNLNNDTDFTKKGFIVTVGFDTFPRSDGEYYLNPEFMQGGFAALEYVVYFSSQNSASLYYVPSYERREGTISDEQWSSGNLTSKFRLKTTLNHGSFTAQNTQFLIVGNTINIRLPWAMLEVTDPTNKLVIKDGAEPSGVDGQYKTTNANGCMCLSFVSNRSSIDTMFIFPSLNNKPTYHVYKWNAWTKKEIKYTMNKKEACDNLKTFFSTY